MNHSDDSNFWSLRCAIRDGDFMSVEKSLLENPQWLQFKTQDGSSLMHVAVFYGGGDMVAFLAEKGAKPNDYDNDGRQPLYYALFMNEDLRATRALLDVGAEANNHNVRLSEDCPTTYLHLAMTTGRSVEFARLLLNHGADPLFADKDGHTPLIAAAQYGRREAALILLGHGADPLQGLKNGQINAISEAERANFPDLAAELLAWCQARDARQAIEAAAESSHQLKPLSR